MCLHCIVLITLLNHIDESNGAYLTEAKEKHNTVVSKGQAPTRPSSVVDESVVFLVEQKPWYLSTTR